MKFVDWYTGNRNIIRDFECLINIMEHEVDENGYAKSIIRKLQITFDNAISLFGDLKIDRLESAEFNKNAFLEITLINDKGQNKQNTQLDLSEPFINT